MRWTYLIPRLLIVALVWGFFFYAFDPIMRWSVTKTGEQMNGAKVDVAEVKTTFFPPVLEMTNVQVADRGKPGRNLLEFENFRVKMASGPLAHRKVVIEEGEITGLTFNTAREDSGQIDDADGFRFREHVQLDDLRNKIKELGETWLQEALAAAKSQLDPQQLQTVQVSQALKMQWTARFQMYEAKLKDIETRVKNLKEGVKPEGNTLQKIEAYRKAALEVQNLIAEAKQMRVELSGLGQTAGGDLQKLELAKQQDLANAKQKLKILQLDKEAISEALLGPELLATLEETLVWAKWTKETIGPITEAKEPTRSRGQDVEFSKPSDPHPEFLIRKLHVSGYARMDGEMIPYKGIIENITNDPKRWGKPVLLDLTIEGASKIHLTASIDRSGNVPNYELTVEYHLPQPTTINWGDAEKLAFQISSRETRWKAHVKLVDEQFLGQLTFQQAPVQIVPQSKVSSEMGTGMVVTPVKFEWDPQQELHRALAGVLGQVTRLDAEVQLTGSMDDPQWTLSSSLGPQVAAGVESYLFNEMTRRQSQLVGEMERRASEEIADFRGVLTEKFRNSGARLNGTETQANELIQKYTSRPLDVRSFFR
ncbi:MAG: TIGR03545 family protein [Planctomycetaceae bacterium]|nr:TIGR03545 family protein [Planctomycetaceae bacterium]